MSSFKSLQIATVNVVEMCGATPFVTSYPDTPEGHDAALAHFRALVLESEYCVSEENDADVIAKHTAEIAADYPSLDDANYNHDDDEYDVVIVRSSDGE